MQQLKNCTLCPRFCRVDRTMGRTGYCGQDDVLSVARAALHMWEEPCISGDKGSGAVFFSGCGMGCIFCQNYRIARGQTGKHISIHRLSDIFLELQEQQAHNINLVTPTHYVPHIIKALETAKCHGLHIPIVYNTSGYENVETLHSLDGLVDIYLPDFKYKSSIISAEYSNAPDYFQYACAAIGEMVRQTGAPLFETKDGTPAAPEEYDDSGIMRRGTIVRHLLLPGCLEDSKEIVRYLYTQFGDQIYLSLMNQYTPLPQAASIPNLTRKVTDAEYRALVDFALDLGVEYGFIQEGETASESFIPEFDCDGV